MECLELPVIIVKLSSRKRLQVLNCHYLIVSSINMFLVSNCRFPRAQNPSMQYDGQQLHDYFAQHSP